MSGCNSREAICSGVRRIHIRPPLQEHAGDIHVIPHGGIMQSRAALRTHGVHVRPLLEKKAHHLVLPGQGGFMQGRHAEHIPCVHVQPLGQIPAHALRIARLRRPDKILGIGGLGDAADSAQQGQQE